MPDAAEPVAALAGQVGTRLPHLWVGPDVSTLDFAARGFTLVACPDAPNWETVAAEASHATGVPLAAYRIGHGSDWATRNALADDGALLVRPDHHVAARTDDGLSPSSRADVLRTQTGRCT